ncbi:11864_t:CDS:2 [Funneliformis mosseae]|uniref:11864_t:CDS:1 n=1 Tax=Funneliformis mosseae TaxID=27381 RepID=A0A9N9HIY9_FUNMO|nr:11864_t:CDS:2 [Funneliformis mosseae]
MNTKNIWYKFEGRRANKIIELSGDDIIDFLGAVRTKERLSCSASTLTLRAKKETVIYTLNDFYEFVKAFVICKLNPIELPGKTLGFRRGHWQKCNKPYWQARQKHNVKCQMSNLYYILINKSVNIEFRFLQFAKMSFARESNL